MNDAFRNNRKRSHFLQQILRLRDNGRYYDLTEQDRLLNPEDPAAHIGLRLVFGCADEVSYSHALQLNNVCIRVARQDN